MPLRVASIGLGWVTTNRHLITMDEDSNFTVVGVVDRRPGRAMEVAKARGYAEYFEGDRLEDVPWLDRVDAVTIGTCPHSHYSLIKSALKQGKHVLTEKPFAMTVNEGTELVTLAREQGLILSIVHNFQFASSTQKLLKDMKEGRFGSIKSIVAQQLSNPKRRLPSWYEELPLGLFYDESPHFFYLVSRLSPGPLELLRSDVYPSTFGDNTPGAIAMQYRCDSKTDGPIPVTVNMNFEAPVSEWHLTVYGEHCLGDIDIFRDIYVCLPNDGLHTTSTVIRTSVLTTWQHWAQHFTSGLKHVAGKLRYGNDTVFGRFAEAVRTGTEPNDVGPDDALKVLTMQHEVIDRQYVLY
ncbi:MAG: Gfo/Idh/MocA family oxidoreductase [Cyanobacteria bacterium P01_E01_bin.34]